MYGVMRSLGGHSIVAVELNKGFVRDELSFNGHSIVEG